MDKPKTKRMTGRKIECQGQKQREIYTERKRQTKKQMVRQSERGKEKEKV